MLRRNVSIAGVILVLGSMAVAASAQGPGGGGMFGFGGGMSSMLLRMPEVQKELNLSDDQKKQVDTVLSEAREKMQASFGPATFQEFQSMSAEEREKRVAEIRKKMEESGKAIDEKVGTILDAKQLDRLNQLRLQREGVMMALARPEVAKKLDLSDEQQAKIKQIQEDARPKGPMFDPNQSPEERQAAMKKMREQFEKARKDCLAVLTDDQMLDWTKMCGKEFKFPQGPRGGFRPPAPPQQ